MVGPEMLILTLQNNAVSPAGAVGEGIAAAGGRLTVLEPLKGQPAPATMNGYDGLLVLGGMMHAGDEAGHPFLADEVRLMRECLAGGRPVLGICLGSQLLSRAAGGRVWQHETGEIGFTPTAAVNGAERDPLLAGLLPLPRLMQWHYDTFSIPEGGELLATGTVCRHQIFRAAPRAYGLQMHLEVTGPILDDWLEADRAYLEEAHPDFMATVASQRQRYLDAAHAFGRAVGRRWAELGG